MALMTAPTQNWCVPTPATDLYIIQVVANDLTIASAVKGTSAGSTLYDDFDDLRNNAAADSIHPTYGTKGVTPTQSHHFRGYPYPTITMNFDKRTYQTYPQDSWQMLWARPQLNNKVGFEVKLQIIVEERSAAWEKTWELVWNAGSIDVDTATIIDDNGTPVTEVQSKSANYYRLETKYPVETTEIDNAVNVILGTTAYYALADSTPYATTLDWVDGATAHAHTFKVFSKSTCGAPPGNLSGGDLTVYSPEETLSGGSFCYTNTDFSTPYGNGTYGENWDVSPVPTLVDIIVISGGSGEITTFIDNCTNGS